MTRNRGRPPKSKTKNVYIQIRVTPEEKEDIRSLAERKRMTISELILYAISKLK